ncbi:MAG: hypothetical protein P8L71_13480 [Flavobacteriales bacterium]|nr:hypothetical protein [Flavobacteriales bacterium]
MMKVLFGCAFCFLTCFGFAQDETRPSNEWFRELAVTQIQELKTGALLVRLPENQIAINLALEKGFVKRAENIQKELDLKNYQVAKAFQHNYTFSEVYFFKASDTEHVKNQQWDSITYYNYDLEPSPPIMRFEGGKPHFTAELTLLRADTTHGNVEGNGDDPMFEALIIKSPDFIQLHKPFPYYVRTWSSLPIRRKTTKVVELLDGNLWLFYKTKGS